MNQAETQMNNLRTNSIYALIILSFATVIAIIEFIHFDNQTWHRIAFSFLFPVLAQLITVSVATFIIAPYISKQSQQPDQNIVSEENSSTQQTPLRLKQNFLEYLDGFSKDVQDIVEKFRFKQQVDNLSDAARLGTLIEKFTDENINLGIHPIRNAEGEILHPGVDNHTIGTLFEQLLRKFNEENSVTEAGEHFTPRDYVALLADIAVLPIAGHIESATYSIYDAACGTGL